MPVINLTILFLFYFGVIFDTVTEISLFYWWHKVIVWGIFSDYVQFYHGLTTSICMILAKPKLQLNCNKNVFFSVWCGFWIYFDLRVSLHIILRHYQWIANKMHSCYCTPKYLDLNLTKCKIYNDLSMAFESQSACIIDAMPWLGNKMHQRGNVKKCIWLMCSTKEWSLSNVLETNTNIVKLHHVHIPNFKCNMHD